MVERASNRKLRTFCRSIAVVCFLYSVLVWATPDGLGLPDTVRNFDLMKYAGVWHQIAFIPNRFQSMCETDTSAEYTPLADGTLRVVNSCRDIQSNLHVADGIAMVGSKYQDAARLKVRFAPSWLAFLPFVWGDYWVLEIDRSYTSVLVGSPDYKFLWILARNRNLSSERYDHLVQVAKEKGFDISKLSR